MSQHTIDAAEPRFLTAGVIAEMLSVPVHRVLYVLNTRQHIRPSGRAGAARVFDREAVTLIRYEIRTINDRRMARRYQR